MEENKTTKCLNCDTEFQGNFCPNCGQRANTGRFTIKFIYTNLLQAILSNDGGVWMTLKSLFTCPGHMIDDILKGRRQRYFSPFPMLYLVLSLYVVIFSITGSREYKYELNDITNQYSEIIENVPETEAEQAKNTILKHGLYVLSFCRDHVVALMILTIPIYILAARVCYGKNNRRKYNWGEYCIPVVYSMIIVALYRCLSSLCFAFSTKLYDEMDNWIWLVSIIAFSMCFKKMFGFSTVKTVWKTMLLHLTYLMIVGFFLLVFVVLYVIIYLDEIEALAS